jgi:type IV pilus assembly protein PilY1
MRFSRLPAIVLLAALAAAAPPARAEDIDIFGQVATDGIKPNVLIVLDSAASNDAAFNSTCPLPGIPGDKLMDSVQCAIAVAANSLLTQPTLLGKINLGLMIYGLGTNPGGQWVAPNSPPSALPVMDATGVANFVSLVSAGYDKSNSRSSSSVMQEAWAFFTGRTGLSGVDYGNHLTIACQRSFVIFIGAAAKQGHPESGHGTLYIDKLVEAGATPAQRVPIDTSTLGPYVAEDVPLNSWTDEWARFMYQTDFGGSLNDRQNIQTYTIAATGGNPSLDYVQHLKSVAFRGGGKTYVAADINSIAQALLQIFYEIQAVNTLFGSASLPVSVNTRGTYQNQVYMGMFRPDPNAAPRWLGNLKQFQFGVDTSDPGNPKLFLADANGAAAISGAGTGFLSPNAQSYWSSKDTSTLPDRLPPGGFWVNNPQSAGGAFDLPDGEIVEKGGVGQQLRLANLNNDYDANPGSSGNPRRVYTCTGACANGSSLASTPFATTNADITAISLSLIPPTSSAASYSRNGTTVTMTLAAAPIPALTNGQQVTISGFGSGATQLNGTFTIGLVNATTFTYTIAEDPPTPSAGTYNATIRSDPKSISSLTRAGTLVTAVVNSHGYSTGNQITISSAAGTAYNGTFPITVVDANTFRYTIIDNPTSPGTGGIARVGSSTATIAVNGIVRDATAADNTARVVVTATANLPSTFAAGAKVTISGATPAAYNVTLAAIIDGARNDACGVNGSAGKKVFCFTLTTTPPSPDTGSAKADRTVTVPIASITHPVACTGSSPTATTTATATTSSTHPFFSGDRVNILGTSVPSGESPYVQAVGDGATITRIDSTRFSYPITAQPPCAQSSLSGVTVLTTTGGVDRDNLINWVRGEDNIGDEQSPDPAQSLVNVRPSIHGDVIHSRPAVINYGGPSNKVVVFYGSNDGQFRAVNGNKTGNIGSVPPGGELWSFVPKEFFSKLQRLNVNLPLLKLATTPTGIVPTPKAKDYYFDGVTGVYQTLSAGATTAAYIFLSARRGGRIVYALDVTDPADPRFLWKKGCPNFGDNVGCDSGFAELGQTWSQPKAAFLKGWANPVVIMGAGYDANEDSEPPDTPGTGHPAMGRGVYVLDATVGCIVWQAAPVPATSGLCSGGATSTQPGMTHAVAADITLVNRDFDKQSKIDRLYVADAGGNIWRVDLEPAAGNTPTHWQVTKLASLGGSSATKRKFLYPPDVITTKSYDLVMQGTGDREHPLYTNDAVNIVNRFYVLKDTKTGMDASGATTIVDATASTSATGPTTLFDATSTPYDGSLAGFYITLQHAGEKVVNGPTTVGGYTYFGTNSPPLPGGVVCANMGTARGYQVNYATGATGVTVFDGGGLPPSPTAGVVTVQVGGKDLDVPFVIGAGDPASKTCIGPDCKSSIGAIKPDIPLTQTRRRVYWYVQKHDN